MEQKTLLCLGVARPRYEPSPALPGPGAPAGSRTSAAETGQGPAHEVCTLAVLVISQSLSHLCHSPLEKRELRGNFLWKITIMLLIG